MSKIKLSVLILLVSVVFLTACGPADSALAPDAPPTAITTYKVVVICQMDALDSRTETFYTNNPKGDGPAFHLGFFTQDEVKSFSSNGCKSITTEERHTWTSKPPIDGDKISADQNQIDQFLADSNK